ncbi:hypothetical protein GF312_05755 [Candidatus Poribacteria bacterium]|nr:hypothetical protein [Candidatus Poribacteria bacterium]
MNQQRESFRAMMDFGKPELLCQFEWGYWGETVERWRNEGLPDGVEPWDDCDIVHYFRPPIHNAVYPYFEREILEEDDESVLVRTESGIICRESKIGMRVPQFIKHPVSNRDDFETIKERLDPKTPGRYPDNWDEWVANAPDFPHILCLGRRENGFFGWLRELMGLEGLLLAYVDQPELVHEICRYHVNYLKDLYEKALQDIDFDFIFMWEDMSYKNGPLISPEYFRTFMLPYYKEMVDFYKQMGGKWVTVDSDGDISKLIPLFIEAGIDGLLPFEVAADMDIVKIRQEFPDLIIFGGIDKREIAKGPKAIDQELESKLNFMFDCGGYLPSMDHHIPPEVSYDNFKYYLKRCRDIYDSINNPKLRGV